MVHVKGTGDVLLKTKNQEPRSKILRTVEPPNQEATNEVTEKMAVPSLKKQQKEVTSRRQSTK